MSKVRQLEPAHVLGALTDHCLVEGNAFIDPDSTVSGHAWVAGTASIINSQISGFAEVKGDAIVINSVVCGDAILLGGRWKNCYVDRGLWQGPDDNLGDP